MRPRCVHGTWVLNRSPSERQAQRRLSATPALSQSAASTDAVTQENIDVLTRSGIIERQARIGEELLIIEREIRRVQQIQTLMEIIGYEGVLTLYPEMADVIEGSPLEIRARLRQAELERDLQEALNPGTDEANGQTTAGAGGDVPLAHPTGIMDAPVAPRPDGEPTATEQMEQADPQGFETALEEARQQIMAEMQAELERLTSSGDAQSAQPISLREIYGSPGNLRAVVFHGAERIQVREGDTLPGGVTVRAIGQDYIDLDRSGREIRLSLRG